MGSLIARDPPTFSLPSQRDTDYCFSERNSRSNPRLGLKFLTPGEALVPEIISTVL